MRTSLLVVCVALSIGCAVYPVPSFPSEDPGTSLVVGVYENPPLVWSSAGEAQGFFPDILREVARVEGWRLTFRDCLWTECLDALEQGRLDLLAPVAYSPERAKRFDMSAVTVFTNWGELYAGRSLPLSSIEDVGGRVVAAVEGDIYTEAFQKIVGTFGLQVRWLWVSSYEEVLRRVQRGEAGCGVVSRAAGMEFNGRYEGVTRTSVAFRPSELRFAAPKGQRAYILSRIDDHLRVWKRDKESPYYTLLDAVVFKSPTSQRVPSWLWWVGGISTAVAIVLALCVVVLRKMVRDRTENLQQALVRLSDESALRESAHGELVSTKHFYTAIFDRLPQCLLVLDDMCRIVWYNPAALVWFRRCGREIAYGMPVDELLSAVLVSDGEVARDVERLFDCVLHGFDREIEWKFARKEGTPPLVAHVSCCCIREPSVHMLMFVQDVTALREAEEHYHSRWSFLQRCVDRMPLPLFVVDARGRVLIWNVASEKITNIAKEEIIGRSLDLSTLFFGRHLPIPALLLLEHQSETIERMMSGKIKVCDDFPEAVETSGWIWVNDQKRYVRIVASTLRDESGTLVGAFQCAQDITDELNLQRSLAQTQKMEAISRLASGIAHDLNNLLTIILGSCDMLSLELGERSDLDVSTESVKRWCEARASANISRVLASKKDGGLRRSTLMTSCGKRLSHSVISSGKILTCDFPSVMR